MGNDIVESPRKRIKTEGTGPSAENTVVAPETAKLTATDDAQRLKEVEVGITEYVSRDNEGFAGILKKR